MIKEGKVVEKRLSAGGIVFREINDKIEFLILEKKKEDGKTEWLLPKGEIEAGEEKETTALREIAEEAGLEIKDLEIQKEIGKENYFYRDKWNSGNLILKTVFYFLVKYHGQKNPQPQKEEGFVKAIFVTPEKALQLLTFKNSQQLIKKALKNLKMEKNG